MKTRTKLLLAFAILVVLALVLGAAFGSEGQNTAYKPQNEFRLDSWIDLPGPFDINKAVLYLFLASVATTLTMVYIARRMQQRPNRVQTAVETLYTFMRDNIAGGNMPREMARNGLREL